jgi:hypothetical protein
MESAFTGQQIDNVLIDGNEFFGKNIRWLRKTHQC